MGQRCLSTNRKKNKKKDDIHDPDELKKKKTQNTMDKAMQLLYQ